MDESKLKWIAAAIVAVLFVVLVPVFIIGLGAQEQHDQEQAALSACVLGADGQVQVPEEYAAAIEAAAQTANLPAAVLAAQLYTESHFDPTVTSGAGARGIAQFMPNTWAEYGNGADPYDPLAGIDAQGRLLRDLQQQIASVATTDEERIAYTLMAYNGGAGAVTRAGGAPSPEVQAYADKILGLAQVDFTSGCQAAGGDALGEAGAGDWVVPLEGARVTSLFGGRDCITGLSCDATLRQHDGLDLSTGGGATVRAATAMKITMVTDDWDQGALVMGTLPDDPGVQILYVHCVQGSHMVSEGQNVTAGTPLCTEGQTGRASAPHLHLEIRKDGTPVDPEPILLSKGIALDYAPGVR